MTSELVTPLSMPMLRPVGIEPVVKSSSSSVGISRVGEQALNAAAPIPVRTARRLRRDERIDRAGFRKRGGTRVLQTKARFLGTFCDHG